MIKNAFLHLRSSKSDIKTFRSTKSKSAIGVRCCENQVLRVERRCGGIKRHSVKKRMKKNEGMIGDVIRSPFWVLATWLLDCLTAGCWQWWWVTHFIVFPSFLPVLCHYLDFPAASSPCLSVFLLSSPLLSSLSLPACSCRHDHLAATGTVSGLYLCINT